MTKHIATGVAILAVGMWFVMAGAAQGRGQGGRPDSVPGGSGGHAPMGFPSGGSASESHHNATHDAESLGPKSPTTLLSQNTKLESKLASFFPNGTDLQTEASGFKNLGQFVSVVHVSHNLGIPFDQLKCTELGTTKATASGMTCPSTVTNTQGMSLGKSIQTLKPDADSQNTVQDADRQTTKDLDGR